MALIKAIFYLPLLIIRIYKKMFNDLPPPVVPQSQIDIEIQRYTASKYRREEKGICRTCGTEHLQSDLIARWGYGSCPWCRSKITLKYRVSVYRFLGLMTVTLIVLGFVIRCVINSWLGISLPESVITWIMVWFLLSTPVHFIIFEMFYYRSILTLMGWKRVKKVKPIPELLLFEDRDKFDPDELL